MEVNHKAAGDVPPISAARRNTKKEKKNTPLRINVNLQVLTAASSTGSRNFSKHESITSDTMKKLVH